MLTRNGEVFLCVVGGRVNCSSESVCCFDLNAVNVLYNFLSFNPIIPLTEIFLRNG